DAVNEVLEQFRAVGVCNAVMAALKSHANNTCVLAISLRALSNLAQNRYNKAQLGGSANCLFVVNTLHMHHQSDGVIAAACQLIEVLSDGDRKSALFLAEGGACECVVWALDTFSSHLQIARHYSDEVAAARGCMAIGSLAEKNKANIELLASHGACGAVLAVTEAAAQWASSDIMALWSGRALNAVCVQSGKSQLDAKLSSEPESRTFEVVVQSLLVHIRSRADIIEENILSIANMLTVDVIKYPAEDICQHLQTAMSLHGNNSGIYIACCKAIRALQSQADEVASCGIPHTILEIMRKHPKNDLVAQWGCEAIASMAVDAKNRDTLVASGACETVIRALQRGTGSDALVAVVLQKSIGNQALGLAACRAVHSLGHGSDAYGERLGANGACEGVAKVLLKYADNEDVAATGCQAIVTLAQNNNSNKSKLGNAGACKLIATLLETHRTSEPVAIWGCRAVEIMVDGHDGNTIRMGSEGVCDAVAIAMQSHQAVAEVAGAGCGAVASLAKHDRNTFILGVAGACEAVVSAVQRHSTEKIIAVKGFAALANLAMNPGNSGWLGPAGACSALIAAMRYHLSEGDVAYTAWRAVADLSSDEGNVTRLGDAGACELLVQAMTLHIGNVKAIEQCCRALSRLAIDRENVKKLIAKACEKVVIALQVHHASAEVAMQTYLAIFGLASKGGADIQEILRSEGCCEIVVSSLCLHGVDSPTVATNGLMAIQALAFNNTATQNALGRCDACDLVVNLILAHEDKEKPSAEGVVALRCLMDDNVINKHRLSGGDTCRIAANALQRHMASDRVSINVCYVIYQLTSPHKVSEAEAAAGVSLDRDNAENISLFLKHGVSTALVQMLYKHMADVELVMISCRAGAALAAAADG
ncbi:aarA, partial [Symbiodinium microadriaticum]